MAMSKKDYVAIAKLINFEMGVASVMSDGEALSNRQAVCRVLAARMADYFESDNKAFSRATFMNAALGDE